MAQTRQEKQIGAHGYVYALSNPSMPGIVKIGRSAAGGKVRAQQMYTTGIPEPFVVEFEMLVAEPEEIEELAHEKLSFCRVSGSREFFRCDTEMARLVIVDCWTESSGARMLWRAIGSADEVRANA